MGGISSGDPGAGAAAMQIPRFALKVPVFTQKDILLSRRQRNSTLEGEAITQLFQEVHERFRFTSIP